ncbi:YggU family protein (plasmid) [Candidatus Pantoea edessiphila]|uniref:UPF0235 protein CRV09_03595 n=1 Tax=Candidatus Pantoea edessiphila TaxID=2044610 RepID=A0A2P5T155_9GAMM|nr:DUF167 family protein [Candidatus Pantoea edessiphila]PPI88315.1 YggU family protein [Candidatus Pantoea edessiphila]
MTYLWYENQSLIMKLYINSNSKKNKIAGIYQDNIKINIIATPIKKRANKCLIKFLSEIFKVSKNNIILEKGEFYKYKQIRINQPKTIPLDIKNLIL